ncbi:DUF2867 domain-containing protein [Actinokineospora pegani]|uniref:DUF2867 domain-containing protein n=1 Tax=Actinokineospora pegani TaxID=2654637 RepID=UPI0018D2E5FA|nr:DUF2867 domain-containing protein [Actinokineospora pegani]
MSTCLVIGAGGYIGRPLVAALVGAGHGVRAMGRSLDPEDVPGGVTVLRGDARVPVAVAAAVAGVDVVYHLVHSMAGDDFVSVDDEIARVVAKAAVEAGVRQVVYLGGPRPGGDDVSAHLASRAGVGDVFLRAPVPALVLQASMIIGAGSASLDLLARASRAAPVLLAPPWMDNRSRPVALDDVLHHLVAAAGAAPRNETVELAGPETVTYLDLVQRYARVARLRRRVPVPIPPLPDGPTATAVSVFSPLPAPLVRALLESLRHDLVPDPAAVAAPPPGGATSVDQALRAALGLPAPEAPPSIAPGLRTDHREVASASTDTGLWRVITDIGGAAGWHTIPGAWALRGAIDHVIGGVGLHRGRPERLAEGDSVDSWTVVERDDERRVLVLRADMRLPGKAWLTLRARPGPAADESVLEQTVTYQPDGVAGTLYWYANKPAHDVVFGLMARGIAHAAERAPLG